MEDFYVDILEENNDAKKKKIKFMKKFKFNLQFNRNTTKIGFHFDHIWSNVLGNECEYNVIEAYWLDFHKLIYNTFKLPNTLPMSNKKQLTSLFF